MAQLPEDFSELEKLVQRDRQELEEARRELEELGRQLKRDWVEKVLRPRVEKAKAEGPGPINSMCVRCLNACKQPASARIFNCARFEPLEGE